MSKYDESIQQIQKNIQKKLTIGKHIVIIGDNAAGKSDILKRVVQSYLDKSENIYFIDAVNRKFNSSLASLMENKISLDSKDITERRLKEEFFNLLDSFGNSGMVESIYKNYELSLKKELERLVNIELEIEKRSDPILGINKNYVLVNNNEVLLSNGYQALIRLLMELLFFEDSIEQGVKAVIVIDEIDKYLSPTYTAKILPYLEERFPDYTFCVTTHARDTLKYVSDYILCILKQDDDGKVQYEFISGSDIGNEKKIEAVFMELFFEQENQKTSSNNELDIQLRRFLNLKLMDAWDVSSEKDLRAIKVEELAPHQKLLYRQIKEW